MSPDASQSGEGSLGCGQAFFRGPAYGLSVLPASGFNVANIFI